MLSDRSSFLNMTPLVNYKIQLGSSEATMAARGEGTAQLDVLRSDGSSHHVSLSNAL